MKNKLIAYCKKQNISDDEGIKIIHNWLHRKGYTKTHWKNARFGFYADSRIKNNGDTTISLVKKIVEMPKYEETFKSFYPYLELNKSQEIINLCKLVAEGRQRAALHRVFKIKGYDLVERYMGNDKIYKFTPQHLRETRKHEQRR
tara:strand:- start:48 stop:482 length:435 start_codon:yes stop_codon:yes gene_type:complete